MVKLRKITALDMLQQILDQVSFDECWEGREEWRENGEILFTEQLCELPFNQWIDYLETEWPLWWRNRIFERVTLHKSFKIHDFMKQFDQDEHNKEMIMLAAKLFMHGMRGLSLQPPEVFTWW